MINKAIKACNEEIKFYKNELKQPYMKKYLPPEEDYIRGHSATYCRMQDGIKTFEFIKSVLEEKQQSEQGCDYCNNNKTILERAEPLLQVSIELSHLVMIDVFGVKGTEITYCPMCGRRLIHE